MQHYEYQLIWNSHDPFVTSSLGAFQQNGDFVDMTLAADGHFVKAHKMVLSLGSKFLKELIQSSLSQHPIVFLNGVSYKQLASILEYIYTGHCTLPSEDLKAFLDIARALHLKGLEHVIDKDSIQITESDVTNENTEAVNTEEHSTAEKMRNPPATPIRIGSLTPVLRLKSLNQERLVQKSISEPLEQEPTPDVLTQEPILEVLSQEQIPEPPTHPMVAASIIIDRGASGKRIAVTKFTSEHDVCSTSNTENNIATNSTNNAASNPENHKNANNTEIYSMPSLMDFDDVELVDSSEEITGDEDSETIQEGNGKLMKELSGKVNIEEFRPKYTVTKRGAPQMILNRYMYNIHHKSNFGHKSRWRCVDYRRKNCKAFIDSMKDVLQKRSFQHTHPFHDSKIQKAYDAGKIFYSVTEIDKRQCAQASTSKREEEQFT